MKKCFHVPLSPRNTYIYKVLHEWNGRADVSLCCHSASTQETAVYARVLAVGGDETAVASAGLAVLVRVSAVHARKRSPFSEKRSPFGPKRSPFLHRHSCLVTGNSCLATGNSCPATGNSCPAESSSLAIGPDWWKLRGSKVKRPDAAFTCAKSDAHCLPTTVVKRGTISSQKPWQPLGPLRRNR